jgi:hypothetical protein
MRSSCVILRVILALAATAASVHDAQAQSFFEKLFGSGASSRPASGPETLTVPPPVVEDRFGSYASESDDAVAPPYGESERSLRKAGSYRTLCVRMCDGYYWPVSSSAQRGKFTSDAKACQASCDMEARLFYLPRASDDIAAMRDLTGRVYGRLPTAFAYRKAVDSACLCKPEPWSEASALRHQEYAAASAETGHPSATSVETSSITADSAAKHRFAPRASSFAPRRSAMSW